MTYEWKIRLFAGLPERIGADEITFADPREAMTAGELKRLLAELHPDQEGLIRLSFVACNRAYAADDARVSVRDELALLPPVSGGESAADEADRSAGDSRFLVTREPLVVEDVVSRVIAPEHGASLVFVGTTREWTNGKRTLRLEYEAYEPMAVMTMRQIAGELNDRWPGARCAIAHRIGPVEIGGISVVIAVSTPHRADCYEASRYAIERLKQIVPIWKKEIWEDGSEWVGHQQGGWNPLSPGPDETGGGQR